MDESSWHDLGPVEPLRARPLQQIEIGRLKIALSWVGDQFAAISGVCNHAGGPLGDGNLDGDYVVCPWHHYKFHRATGEGEPGYEDDRVPCHELRETDGRLFVNPRDQASRREA